MWNCCAVTTTVPTGTTEMGRVDSGSVLQSLAITAERMWRSKRAHLTVARKGRARRGRDSDLLPSAGPHFLKRSESSKIALSGRDGMFSIPRRRFISNHSICALSVLVLLAHGLPRWPFTLAL